MKREAVEEFVSSVVEKVIAGTELELVDVDYVRERDWYLRVYLDKPGGVDLDDCQMVSEKLSAALDEKDPITENYLLEVSSPGLDRVLKKDKDFIRYNGRDVDIQLFKTIGGLKQYTGTLQGFNDDTIEFLINGESMTFERSSIAQIRLHLDF
ncbi:ribosome maturation factor RimP [Veillonella caviae]|uniref:ribosome maturation factor RimP n=1 Tax=Veillonella caviae TaxID=248316 RepID=UPI002A918E63|nr:ribosome maturation factor RimP [Veillonella caviae]MDD7290628.1 ribosome maturation factor RimP [Veillonella caviae]MDY5787258.1 ribosome maturation factor RimP [Veillonella caviae]